MSPKVFVRREPSVVPPDVQRAFLEFVAAVVCVAGLFLLIR